MLSTTLRRAATPLLRRSASRGFHYKAPTRDMTFVLKEVLDCETHYSKIGYDEASWDTVEFIMHECAKFTENVLPPLLIDGDRVGCKHDPETCDVKTPDGFKEAYQQWSEAGWSSLTVPEEYGGQGMPVSVGILRSEMAGVAQWGWAMYPGLSMGAINTLLLHASQEQKDLYLPKLAEGSWLGTMCLTEPQCGTDLGQVSTSAVPVEGEPDKYKINGTKIFISAGEHDLGENIVHIVLARLPGAPEGTRGISLFIVPKYLPTSPDGSSISSERNVRCSRIEDKMGIHSSATAQLEFEDSIGFLVGEPNKGLQYMFSFMNTARLGTGLQGIGAAESAYQIAAPYAKERISMRALSGTQYKDKAADPIIVHPDVRRMLLTMRAVSEGGRALLYECAMLGDYWLAEKVDAKKRDEVEEYMGVLTPIVKGFLTELGVESASHAIQVWGGHGYIKDNYPEQNYRDARISTLYEGTTGVQALDLLGRKVLLNRMKELNKLQSKIISECMKHVFASNALGGYARQLLKYVASWKVNTVKIGMMAAKDKEVVGAASVDYLYYSGYITLGYYWLRMASVATEKLAAGSAESLGADEAFYRTKLATAEFYFSKLLPRADSHAATMLNGTKGLMNLKNDEF